MGILITSDSEVEGVGRLLCFISFSILNFGNFQLFRNKMPGHDHHFNFVFQPGDLNTEAAALNWICPVEEDDGEDITVLFKRSVCINFNFLLYFKLFSSFLSLRDRYSFLCCSLFGDFIRRMNTVEVKKSFLETSAVRELFGPEQCQWNEILRYRRKIHL